MKKLYNLLQCENLIIDSLFYMTKKAYYFDYSTESRIGITAIALTN